jgi:myo-inositol-1(or 4)-monophosphatase
MFTAIRGRGAYLNLTTPLPLKARPEPLMGLSNALVSVEWGSDRSGRNWDTKFETIRRLASSGEDGGAMVHSLRCMGSAALNFCAVAAGYVDAYWVSNLSILVIFLLDNLSSPVWGEAHEY